MSFHILIPARLASTRLPNKPLADVHGAPMVVRVAQRAALAPALQVVVAADDESIVHACQAHGVKAILTRSDHTCGSDRLAEACHLLALDGDDLVVNVQGDEPLLNPELITACAETLRSASGCVMSTAAHPIHSIEEFLSPHVVKVVLDAQGRALYFSRAPIPMWRDGPGFPASAGGQAPPTSTHLPTHPPALRHIGLYAYRAGFLRRFPQMSPAAVEQTEALEQLRVLWHGERIAVHVTPHAPGAGVDTPADLERVRREWIE